MIDELCSTTREEEVSRSMLLAALLATAPLLALPSDAIAQLAEPSPRAGFWFNGGLGYGSLGCEDCGARTGGFTGSLAIGGTISQRVLLGAASHVWSKTEGGVTLTASTLAAVIRFYPSATGDFFLLGGLGLGNLDLGVSGYGNLTEAGAGAVIGLGYDIRVGNSVSLTPFWNGVAVATSEGSNVDFGQVGLGLSVH